MDKRTSPFQESEELTKTSLKITKFINFSAISGKTIATGVITYTAFRTRINNEGGNAADNLDTINGGTEGDLILLESPSNGAETATVKNGTGNILCNGDFAMAGGDNKKHMLLIFTNGNWSELFRITF
jgi:hypothetical protein